jgi:hypothetical protein
MKIPSVIPYMLTIMLLGSTAAAQNDWRAVKALLPETRIKVTVRHGHGSGLCIFKEATDNALTCSAERHGLMAFRRENVRTVYLSPERSHGGTGPPRAVLAAAIAPVIIVGVFAGPVPLAIGTGAMGITYALAKHSVHGKAVYRSPSRTAPASGEDSHG